MNWITCKSRMVAAACLLAAAAAPARAALTFQWSMESETPDIYPAGSDSTPSYYPVPIRSAAAAHSGDYAADLSGGAWRAATFDNPTNDDVWASTDEGAVVLWWKYTGSYSGAMLMQITGKSSNGSLDTNDGVSIRFHGDTALQLGYGWDGENWGSTYIRYNNYAPFQADHWYKVTARWNTATAPYLSLQVDDLPAVTGGTQPQETLAVAWHQLLIGNDRNTAPDGLYLDDFQVYNDFAMTPEPGSLTLLMLGVLPILRRRRGRQ